MAIKFKPLGDRILVEPDPLIHLSPGGLLIPEQNRDKSPEGIVRAVGPGRRNRDGQFIEPEFEPGERVMFRRTGGTELKIEGRTFRLLESVEILAKVE